MASARFAKVLQLAEELSETERLDLVRELASHLPENPEEEERDAIEEEKDRDEIRRRVAAVREGTATLISREAVREILRRDE